MNRFTKERFWIILISFIFSFKVPLYGQNDQKTSPDSLYTVIYFGATSCYYCTIPENIANVTKMAEEIKQRYKDLKIKTLIISMDTSFEEGIEYIKKYGTGNWDEMGIGSFYNNELALFYLNNTKIPGVPHVFVIKHSIRIAEYNVPQSTRNEILVDLVGATQIDKWLKDGYYFKK